MPSTQTQEQKMAQITRSLLLSVVVLFITAGQTRAGFTVISTSDNQIQPGADNQGWVQAYSNNNHSMNDNYLAGNNDKYRNFFAFDLSGVRGKVTSARLEVRRYDSNPGQTYELSAVSTSAADLVASRSSAPHPEIFEDLGSGTSYGAFKVGQGASTDILGFNLRGDAIADINAALGGFFSIGGKVVSSGYLFGGSLLEPGNSEQNHIQQLVLEVAPVPEPGSLAIFGVSGLGAIAAGRRRRKQQQSA